MPNSLESGILHAGAVRCLLVSRLGFEFSGFGFWVEASHVLDFVLEVMLQGTVLLGVDLWLGVMIFGLGL